MDVGGVEEQREGGQRRAQSSRAIQVSGDRCSVRFVRGLRENYWGEFLPSNVLENLLTMRGAALHLSTGHWLVLQTPSREAKWGMWDSAQPR